MSIETLEAPPKIETKFGKPKSIGEVWVQLVKVKNQLEAPPREISNKYSAYKIDKLSELIEYFVGSSKTMTAALANKNQDEILQKLEDAGNKNPDLLLIYRDTLAYIRKYEEFHIKDTLNSFNSKTDVDPERREHLDDITIKLDGEITDKQSDQLREMYKSGNFLLHTTDVKKSMMIIESGAILTAAEVEEKLRKSWSRGGKDGISFNMNNVRVLTGDPGHFIGFLTSPETI